MNPMVSGIVFYVVFVYSTSLHEAAHAWAALKGGDSTAYRGGQVSLDPMVHIRREPFGMVILPILSVILAGWPIGFASAPYDRHWAVRHPRRAAWMALAGPGANLLLVLTAGLLINAGLFAGVFEPPKIIDFADVTRATAGPGSVWQSVGLLLGSVFAMNLLLAVFNLLPLPPLDGSSALVLVMPGRWVHRYQTLLWSNPQLGLLGILVAWKVFKVFFDPAFTMALNALYVCFDTSYGR